jgi:hypothetical protein
MEEVSYWYWAAAKSTRGTQLNFFWAKPHTMNHRASLTVSEKAVQEKQLEGLFDHFRGAEAGISPANFLLFAKTCTLIGGSLTEKEVGRIFQAAKLRNKSTLDFARFQEACRKLATTRQCPYNELIDIAIAATAAAGAEPEAHESRFFKMKHMGAAAQKQAGDKASDVLTSLIADAAAMRPVLATMGRERCVYNEKGLRPREDHRLLLSLPRRHSPELKRPLPKNEGVRLLFCRHLHNPHLRPKPPAGEARAGGGGGGPHSPRGTWRQSCQWRRRIFLLDPALLEEAGAHGMASGTQI